MSTEYATEKIARVFARPLDFTDQPPAFAERFWSKVNILTPNECWEWKAYRKPSGYGQFVVRKGVFMTASRVALALTLGPLARGQVACHTRDNPPCCNPAHLFSGTQHDNAVDSVLKGRANRAFGMFTASSKLTDDQVCEIRKYPSQYGLAQRLAHEFGVSETAIRRIRNRMTWTHLPDITNPLHLCVKGHPLTGANLLDRKAPVGQTFCAKCAEAFRVGRHVKKRVA